MDSEEIRVQEPKLGWRHSYYLPVLVLIMAFTVDTACVSALITILPNIVRDLNDEPTESSNASVEAYYEVQIGLIAGIGPLAEFLADPFVGFLVRLIGDKSTFNLGSVLIMIGIVLLMEANYMWQLVVGRIMQSLGSSLGVVAGLSLLASRVPDKKRMRAFNIAYFGFTFGYLIGYPLGGVMYDYAGRRSPFLVILCISVMDFLLRFLIPNTKSVESERSEFGKFFNCLKDPYILVILLMCVSIYSMPAITSATLPNYLTDVADPEQIGVMYFIAILLEAIVQLGISPLVKTHGCRFSFIIVAGMIQVAALVSMYFVFDNSWLYVAPLVLLRVAEGIFGAMATSLLAYVSDKRELNAYKYIYGLYAASYTFGMGVGPMLAGYLTTVLGFRMLNVILGGVALVCTTCGLYLRSVKAPKRCRDDGERARLITDKIELG